MKRLLLTGISGFLGRYLIQHPQENWEIIGTYYNNEITHPKVETVAIDLCDEMKVSQLLHRLQPSAILHLAAYSKPNLCEKQPEQSYRINVEASLHLARWAVTQQIPFLFTSTDLVFDGQHRLYKETDSAQAVNLYGQHKLQAEQQILATYPDATIARLPLLYGWEAGQTTYLSNMIASLQKGEEVKAFGDEYRTMASGSDAAAGLFLLLEKELKGHWHLGGRERLSRYEFAQIAARVFELSTAGIKNIGQNDLSMPAARPPDVSLDSSRAYAQGYAPSSVEEALKRIKVQLVRH